MQNLEFKATLRNFDGAVEVARAIGARGSGVLQQVDTYFNTSSGRVKLREFVNSEIPAELIAYQRADEAVARLSTFERCEIDDPGALKRGLAATLGVRAVVEKDRHLFLWEGVRIHIDRVSGLGDFIEFEAVLGEGETVADAERRLGYLTERFGIGSDDILSTSYADLLLDVAAGPPGP